MGSGWGLCGTLRPTVRFVVFDPNYTGDHDFPGAGPRLNLARAFLVRDVFEEKTETHDRAVS
jgi:hypothetical protein